MTNSTRKPNADTATSEDRPAPFSRRSLLKGSVKAMPVVLTLHSGAALARSSNTNLISESGGMDFDGNYRCLETRNLMPVAESESLYDFGNPRAFADVAVIPDRRYFAAAETALKPVSPSSAITPNSGWKPYNGSLRNESRKVLASKEVSVAEMCARGGEYYYEEAGAWNCVRIEKGMLVSSTALHSFSSNLNFPSINNCEL
jgi:hypothetical protein